MENVFFQFEAEKLVEVEDPNLEEWQRYDPDRPKKTELQKVPVGERVIFELRSDVVPRTCKNFVTIVQGNKKGKAGNMLTYCGTAVHRVVPGKLVQGGMLSSKGGESIYNGKPFKDENFKLKHEPFVLSMANSGKNKNTSQWFVNLVALPDLDGKHVVFGRVKEGHQVFQEIAVLVEAGTKVFVKECGLID